MQTDGGTYNGQTKRNCGGVGRNVAEALIKLGLANTRFISVVGDDEYGKTIIDSLGAGAEMVKRLPDVNTARYEFCFIELRESDSLEILNTRLHHIASR